MPCERADSSESKANEHREGVLQAKESHVTPTSYIRIKLFGFAS